MANNTVILDIDGVLADFTLGFTKLANKMFGTPLSTQSIQPVWNHLNVMTAEQDAKVWKYINQHPEWWGTLEPCLDYEDYRSLDAVRFAKPHHSFIYLTNRPTASKAYTIEWLWRNRLPYGDVCFTDSKAAFVSRLASPPLVVLEDAPHNLIALRASGAPVVAMHRLYNANIYVPRIGSIHALMPEGVFVNPSPIASNHPV